MKRRTTTIWAVIATVLSILLGVKTITGLSSCNDYALAAEVDKLENMVRENALQIGKLTVHMTHLTGQIERIDERSRICE